MHKDVINALLPDGKFWEVKPESDLDKLYDGCAENADSVMDDMEKIAHLRDPYTTVMLDDLEREYGLVPITGATDQERRERLFAFKCRRNSTGAYDVLQQKLRDAGFADVYVYQNSPIIYPNDFLARAFNMTCGDLLPAGHEAQCGEPEALCASVGGELVVNGDLTISTPIYNVQCDDGVTCGDGSCSGDFSGYKSTGKDAAYTVPELPQYWPFVFFVGGVAEYNGYGELSKIAFYNIPSQRRLDFRRIILRFKPLFSWGALIVEYN